MTSEFDSEFDATGGGSPIDLKGLVLYGVARSWYFVVIGVILGIAGGIAMGVITPNEFKSIGKLRLRLGLREARTPDIVVQGEMDALSTRPAVIDELELLDNPEVHRLVALEVGPERLLSVFDPAQDDTERTAPLLRRWHALQSWWFRRQDVTRRPNFDPAADSAVEAAARVAAESTTIYNEPRSSILKVLVDFHDPTIAQDLGNAYITVAQDYHREEYRADVSADFIEAQMEQARGEYNRVGQEYTAHRAECGFYDLDTQMESLVTDVNRLERETEAGRIRINEIGRLLTEIDRELGDLDPTVEQVLPPEKIENPRYKALLGNIEGLQQELEDLGSTYREGSAAYVSQQADLRGRIGRIQEQLDGLDYFVEVGGERVGRVPNPQIGKLRDKYSDLRLEREGLTVTVEDRERIRGELSQRLKRALDCEPMHGTFELNERQARVRLEEIGTVYERNRMLDTIDSNKEMNSLRVIQPATYPVSKSAPSRLKFLLMGLAAGLFGGAGLAVLRQVLDPNLRYPDNLEDVLGVQLLGVVPETRGWRSRGRDLRLRAEAEI